MSSYNTLGAIPYGVLRRIYRDNASISQIAKDMPEGIVASNVYVALHRLKARGMVEYAFDAHPGDRRGQPTKHYKLTDKGIEVLERTEAIHG